MRIKKTRLLRTSSHFSNIVSCIIISRPHNDNTKTKQQTHNLTTIQSAHRILNTTNNVPFSRKRYIFLRNVYEMRLVYCVRSRTVIVRYTHMFVYDEPGITDKWRRRDENRRDDVVYVCCLLRVPSW